METSKDLVDANRDRWIGVCRALALELCGVQPATVIIHEDIRVSFMSQLKIRIEEITGQKWNWWPLKPLIQPLKHNSV